MKDASYACHRNHRSRPLDQAEATIWAALADQGFGVLTEMTSPPILEATLGFERPALKILGACNPTFAHQALELDPSTAVVLPCNVALEPGTDGSTRISVGDVRELMPDPAFAELADAAASKLTAALRAVSS